LYSQDTWQIRVLRNYNAVRRSAAVLLQTAWSA